MDSIARWLECVQQLGPGSLVHIQCPIGGKKNAEGRLRNSHAVQCGIVSYCLAKSQSILQEQGINDTQLTPIGWFLKFPVQVFPIGCYKFILLENAPHMQ
jgi:hypothetical protein